MKLANEHYTKDDDSIHDCIKGSGIIVSYEICW